MASGTPVIRTLRAIPVTGRDSMLLELGGAHGPVFARNLLVLADSAGRTGVGEAPGGARIRQTLDLAGWPAPDAGAAARRRRPRPGAAAAGPGHIDLVMAEVEKAHQLYLQHGQGRATMRSRCNA